jgi:hypothetical protein
MILYFYACNFSKSDSGFKRDTGTESQDKDGDGYSSVEEDFTLVDCDDDNPNITPDTHRYIPSGSFQRGWEFSIDTVLVF